MSWEATAGEGDGGGGEKWMDSRYVLQKRPSSLLMVDVGFEIHREVKETLGYLVCVIR